MATTPIARHDECLVERDEVLFPQTNMIDTEPFYKNFKTIKNRLRYQRKSLPTINGYIFNLLRIVEDIGYHPLTPFLHNLSNSMSNKVLNNFDKYSRSASLNRSDRLIKKTTQKSDDNQPNIYTCQPGKTFKKMDEKHFQNNVLRMYGFDDLETISSTSSRRSSIDELNSTPPDRQSTPVPLETIDNSKPKQQITIREYYPSKDIQSVMVNRSISPSSSSSQQAVEDIDYEQFIADHPELLNDPNPEIVIKPNPNQVTYQQNVSVRYLVPPTPPPPGPLIIREIIPPQPPMPPPLVIKQQEPSQPTPPPIILREAPPTPPPHQEAKIITKTLPQESPSPQRVIIEHNPPLPAKPQSIIIEKWLPYKPPPPRKIIYERVVETPVVAQFQPDDRPRRHSADILSKSSTRLPIPVHIERQNSFDHLNTQQSSAFDVFARSTQQQLRTIQAHHRWIANQHQQHMNLFQQLTTPALIVHHPPVIRTATSSYLQHEDMFYQPTLIYPT